MLLELCNYDILLSNIEYFSLNTTVLVFLCNEIKEMRHVFKGY